ncbi:hydrogenase expression/formation C-terminal domain-containing protein [Thiohalorhabdus sp.]|uniref:hydrogenase expression/formation C-terminal domain-containing protein n=1 Tax=Thiohalorhabdus sp. TaxID=3094134 RepID=UPI002FC29646
MSAGGLEAEDWSQLPAPVISLLQEIAVRLDRLVSGGEPEAIDLRALPIMTEEDLQQLRDLLGTGEVTATVQAMGATELEETAFPGVWWATYFGADGDMVAERIEMAWVPDILVAQAADVRTGLQQLVERLPEAAEADREGGAEGAGEVPPVRWSDD